MRRALTVLMLALLAAPGCGRSGISGGPSASADAARRPLGVVTCNVWGLPVAAALTERLARLPAALRALDADVVCLQEVWTASQRADLAAGLAPALTVAPVHGGGLLLAARGVIREARFRPFPAFPGLSLVERIAGKGWIEAIVETRRGTIRVVTTHLAHRGPQAAQLDHLLAHLPVDDGLPLVLAGDFNLAPDDEALAALRALGLADARPPRRREDGTWDVGPPTRVGWPRTEAHPSRGWCPDHIHVRGLMCVEAGLALDTPATALSDHNAVWALLDPRP